MCSAESSITSPRSTGKLVGQKGSKRLSNEPSKGQNLPAVADGEALCRQVFQAAKAGDSERLEGLLLLGAPVNYTEVGTTVLHAAAASGNLETVRLLIKAGAPPQTVAPGGVTILHEAARGGAKDVVDIVLAAGLSPNVVDSFGATPLHIASIFGKVDAVRALISAGANASLRTKEGKTATMLAATTEIRDILQDAAAEKKQHQGGYAPPPNKDTVQALKQRLELADDRVQWLEKELAAAKRVNSDLRQQLATAGSGGLLSAAQPAGWGSRQAPTTTAQSSADRDALRSKCHLSASTPSINGHTQRTPSHHAHHQSAAHGATPSTPPAPAAIPEQRSNPVPWSWRDE